jgi:hypothetical protein
MRELTGTIVNPFHALFLLENRMVSALSAGIQITKKAPKFSPKENRLLTGSTIKDRR